MRGVSKATGGFSRGFLSGAGALSSFGGALALTSGSFFAGAGIVSALGASVHAAGDFETSLNVLQQVTGATAKRMKEASAVATRLGADISLPATSALDAANAMTELAKGGLTVKEAMAAARGTLQLAAAAQTDVGSAAQITARSLTAFNLSGADAGVIADALANGAQAATGDITDFAIGLQQSATVAHQFGLSAQDTVAALTDLAKAGLVGSDAGTSLRVMLSRLVPSSVAAKKEMHALGIVTSDAKGQFLPFRDIISNYSTALRKQIHALGIVTSDAKGQFLPFRDIISNYSTALRKLSPVARQHALQTIFGTDAQRAANILLGAGVGRYDRLREAIGKQGGAAQAAAARQKGFNGALDAFKSTLQTTAITVGTVLLPTLTRYLREAAKWLGDAKNQARVQRDVKQALHLVVGAIKDVAGAFKTASGLVGGFKHLLELLVGLKLASVARGWVKGIDATKGSSKLAAKEVAGLRLGLLGLSGLVIAPIVIPIIAKYDDKLRSGKGAKGVVGKLLSDLAVPSQFVGDAFDLARANAKTVNSPGAVDLAGLKRKPEAAGGASAEAGAKAAAGIAKTYSHAFSKALGPALVKESTAAQRSTFFDNAIARILLRGGLGDVQKQIAAITRVNVLIAARIKVTKDVTRRRNLEDQLLQNASQIKGLRQQAVSDFISSLQFGLTKAQATAVISDDIAAFDALAAGIRKRMKSEGNTLDLQQQLFDVTQQRAQAIKDRRQQVAEALMAALQFGVTKAQATAGFTDDIAALNALAAGIRKRMAREGKTLDLQQQLFDALQQKAQAQKDRQQKALDDLTSRQFRRLGFSSTGDAVTPTVSNLQKQLGTLSARVTTPKLRSELAKIRGVLAEGIVPKDIRAKIVEMFQQIRDELGKGGRNLTKFRHTNSNAVLAGLGLTPDQIRSLRSRISQIGAGGTVPGAHTAAFAGAGAVTVHTSVNLDGKTVAQNTTKHQRKAETRRSSSRRGPYAGRH